MVKLDISELGPKDLQQGKKPKSSFTTLISEETTTCPSFYVSFVASNYDACNES
jgi:hypothetical protein